MPATQKVTYPWKISSNWEQLYPICKTD